MSEATKSVWVDIRTTQQVVATGFRTILERADGPFEITLDTPAAGHEPDIVLYDVIKLNDGNGSDLEHLLKDTVSTVIAIDRTLKPELGTRAKEKASSGPSPSTSSRGFGGRHLRRRIGSPRRKRRGPGVGLFGVPRRRGRPIPRESGVLQLVVLGHSNQEIADTLFLSINSVKTYIRSTYRKIGATTRAQAIVWAIHHGFPTQRLDGETTPI